MRLPPLPELLLRLAVAFSFAYPPLAALSDPDSWIGYFPAFIPSSILLLHIFGAVELVIALWLVLGKRIIIPSVLAAFILAAIVILNGVQFDVLFRDISIALAALALGLMDVQKRRVSATSS